MDKINNYNQNINFTAKMPISSLTPCKARWENIAQLFESRTRNYPDDVFEIVTNRQTPDEISFFQYGTAEHCQEYSVDLTKKQTIALLEKADEVIAEKLVKLFNIFKRQDEDYKLAGDFYRKLNEGKSDVDPTGFEDKFWEAVVTKCMADTKIAIQKDPTLRGYKYY